MPGRPADQNVKILYIEDNRENRMLVRAVLEAAGYLIVDAEDGLAGIEAAIREEPALILLDIFLPQVAAYEIVAILKSFPNLASTPVIAVTAYAMQGDRQRTLVAGCDGYLQKPINVDAFPRQVAEFLGGKRERVEGREEGVYLRELNQRLVYRLLNQVEELKRLRSEEHTSELQSRGHLVCRLLLEKKKMNTTIHADSASDGLEQAAAQQNSNKLTTDYQLPLITIFL